MTVGGGCGAPDCDYQVQCGACSDASNRQYADWFRRAGYPRSLFRLVIDEMHTAAHAEAINDDQFTSGGVR